ncbi:MAG: hypothetical protein ACRDF4_08605, partial [Rhabdochlamydiaceae bacterium]
MEGIIDPRHGGTVFYKPGQWLFHEASQITTPFKGVTRGAQFEELMEKVARIVCLLLTPVVLGLAATGGSYNLLAHLISPLTVEEKPALPPEPPPPVVIPPEQLAFITSINKLNQDYERIFTQNGLHGIREEAGKAFQARIKKLQKQIALYQENQSAHPSIRKLANIASQFPEVYKQRHVLINAPIQMNEDGVIASEDRGNCFYDTVCKALQLYGCFDEQASESLEQSHFNYRIQPDEMRKSIIEWCRAYYSKDPYFQGLVKSAIGIYVEDIQTDIFEKKQTIEALAQEDTRAIQEEIKEMEKRIRPFQDETTKVAYYFHLAEQPKF